jgi:hypothetical protein
LLSPSTAGPIVQTLTYGAVPAGLFLGADVGNGPGIFRLSAAIDGCVTEYEWFAWVPSQSPSPGEWSTITSPGQLSVTIPPGSTGISITCRGGGGAGDTAPGAGAGGGGGGGGGAEAVCIDPALTPGTYTIQAGNGGVLPGQSGDDAWASITGVAPTTTAQGCLAAGGAGGAGVAGGAGGLAAASIGTSAVDGTDGGDSPASGNPVIGSSGGGGGGAGSSAGPSTGGGPGVLGPSPVDGGAAGTTTETSGPNGGGGAGGPDINGTTLQGVPGIGATDGLTLGGGGGGGGGSDDAGGQGPPGVGGNGSVTLTWTTAGQTQFVLTVIESFRPALQPAPPPTTFTAQLPTLDAAGLAALHNLMKKVAAAQTPTPGSQ